MRKIIAAFNMTLDGVYDHTEGTPDVEIHQHYTHLLSEGGVILYGRTTYQLMEFWKEVLENPTEDQSMNDFAVAIDSIPKIVFSHTLKTLDWKSATVAKQDLKTQVLALKRQTGKPILVGSRSLIIQLLHLNLIDEFQLCIYPVVAGRGSVLFENLKDRIVFNLVKQKRLSGGAVIMYYRPVEAFVQS